MFKRLHFRALLLFCCFWAVQAGAQGIQNPTHWEYAAVKQGEGTYEIRISLKLDKAWHIWAIDPQGDGMQIPPTFKIESGTDGKDAPVFRETGKKHLESMEGIDKPVAFYSDSVTYSAMIRSKAGNIVKGTHTYQVCNDMICLPPTTIPFTIKLP